MYKDKVKILNVQDIPLGQRTRDEHGDIRELATSLEAIGQINPITVENGELRAGGRRMFATMYLMSEDPPRAIRGLEPGQIRVLEYLDLKPVERLLVEYHENFHRKGFNKGEEALIISRLKVAMEEAEGKKISDRRLVSVLKVSKSHVSMALAVADAIEKDDRNDLRQASSIAGAYRDMKNQDKIQELLDRAKKSTTKQKDYSDALSTADAVEWISRIPDESIDFINFDPPWGIGIDSYDRQHNYGDFDDSSETGIKTAKALVPALYRVLKEDTYCIVWFGIQYYQFLYQELEAAGFKVHPVPMIWYKTNKGGAQNDPTRTMLNVYEPAFLVEKGEARYYKHAVSNVIEGPLPRGPDRVHFAQKDLGVMKEIIERFCPPTGLVMDPTCGSGSFLVAAQVLGRPFLGCDKEEKNVAKAIDWLRRTVT